ncbi:MAG: 2-C-methyl-D-erythritol 4-phosphate cytidylyltransferase [Clostridia bacterium]|nr:2-C-methyl-D-erythritol 4-phosphate cytidylyltransferase [Clostridia bacterium]
MFAKTKRTVAAVIPAAGSASRMKGADKLFLELNGIPVIIRTLKIFEDHPEIAEIVIPTRADAVEHLKALCSEYGISKATKVICGGATRGESVLLGLRAVDKKCKYVAIHDGARPFVTESIVSDTIAAARKFHAAAPMVPIVDTIKEKDGCFTSKTVDRDSVCAIQTPQIFDRELILGALHNAVEKNIPITDDCSAVEIIGGRIALTQGDVFNRKITTPEDLVFARAILESKGEK